jgi:hypothetical protein
MDNRKKDFRSIIFTMTFDDLSVMSGLSGPAGGFNRLSMLEIKSKELICTHVMHAKLLRQLIE